MTDFEIIAEANHWFDADQAGWTNVLDFVKAVQPQFATQTTPTWTAIADQKPPTMQDVLFAGEHEGKPVIHIGYLSWRDNLYVILTIGRWTPTHWMPLPAPPK